jgi:hypothetical protein
VSTALDRAALAAAKRLGAAQPRADVTIPQLPLLTAPASTDLLPIFHNGQTYAIEYGQVTGLAFAPTSVIWFDVAGIGANNTNLAVVQPLPIALSPVFIAGVVACCLGGSSTGVNVVVGFRAPTYAAGNTVLASDLAVTAPGAVYTANAAFPLIPWGPNAILTLRASTSAGNGVTGLKVGLLLVA